MGQAKRKGTFEERKQASIKRKKDLIIEKMGGRDEHLMEVLRIALAPFFAQMSAEGWQTRRRLIIASLNALSEATSMENAKPIRIREDEIGWYLFLCEQIIEDPLCVEISQAQRILPFFAGIGERWRYAANVTGLERKIREVLTKYKSEPDGVIFEILVALAYAAKGWEVELIEESSTKSPDMVVRKAGIELFIECKRLDRRTAYSEEERNHFLRLWNAAVPVLIANKQWVWLKAAFHTELSSLPTDFLTNILQQNLPIESGEKTLCDTADVTIQARFIDRRAVDQHIENFMVKEPSPMLNHLLGGDWAPDNSEVSAIYLAQRGTMVDCEAPVLSTYVQKIDWACGITRSYDSEASINKKARDITKLLSKAVEQVPEDRPSIIHVAAETLEGRDVEFRRTEKVMGKLPTFVTDRPVLGIRFHRFQSHSRTDKLYEFDETVEKFQVDGVKLLDIPSRVVVPDHVELINGRHWEIYE